MNKHNTASLIWSSLKNHGLRGPAFSGDLSIMSSRAYFYKSELNLSLNTTYIK